MQLLAKLTYSIEANVGAGFHGAYFVGYDKNKGQFTFAISAQICFGAGWKGSFACVIGADAIQQMIVFLYEQLKLTNFDINKLIGAVLQSEAYETISKLIVVAVWTGEAIGSFIKDLTNAMTSIQAGFASLEDKVALVTGIDAKRQKLRENALQLAKNIKLKSEIVSNAMPLAKGQILWQLIQYNNSNIFEPNDADPMDAVNTVLGSINSCTEGLNILINIIDKDSTIPIGASQGAKELTSGLTLFSSASTIIQANYIRIINNTLGLIYASTDMEAKQDLRSAYLLFINAVSSTVVIPGDVINEMEWAKANTKIYIQKVQQPLFAE